jgi:hypothetical protein
MNNKLKIIFILVTTTIIFGGLFLLLKKESREIPEIVEEIVEVETEAISLDPQVEIVGNSVEGRIIESYTFGESSDNNLLFVGGIHGGYEWNSVLLAYYIIDYLTLNKDVVPEGMQVTIVPSLNPDGLYKVVGKEGRFSQLDIPVGTDESIGRFNANGIDLNRNFACNWKPESSWRGNVVSAGTIAFSEPESRAIRDLVTLKSPEAVVFWHSQGNAVYASECNDGILPETIDIMNTYSKASGYSAIPTFDAYEISGDAEGWLASIGVPAITVELKTHETIEGIENIAGFKSLIEYYKNK